MPPDPVAKFISRWSAAQAAERANYQLFLSELCDVLDVPRPDPATDDTAHNAYVFERAVTFHHAGGKTSIGRIDLYRRGAFVCEAKQYATASTPESAELTLELAAATGVAKKSPKIARGTEAWDRAMIEAHAQAERYARSLPNDEDPPPFLLVVDVGHVIELYADFTQKGKAYLPFPEARTHRIRLTDLAREDVRAKLRAVWLEPHSLDPAKIAAAVTRDVAAHLAELAKSFEKDHPPAAVAAFLSRCLFCMFAEDVELLPKDSFSALLESVKGDPAAAVPLLKQLFAEMNVGRFSVILRREILQFNGGLFADATVLPLNATQLGLLRAAAKKQWRHVEPAIFGTLLERALDPHERHKLGAHYTPRAYVERLVLPTVVEPLREEWSGIRTAAVTLVNRATEPALKEARKLVREFHHRLCAVRVLDPACGSGNFLYVTLEHLKRLEGEVLQHLESLGENMRLDLGGETVDPHQFLGLEINPRAAAIAELVLWIGYLQWHHRNRGATEWPEPVLRAFKNIECRDAVLAHDGEEFAKDEHGQVRYVWDRRTYKTDPVTGRDIPDDKAVIPLRTYKNPRPAEWPQADFIVGNPPFLGNKRMREDLGDGYTETLRAAYPAMPESADFVMFWWHKAARETLVGRTRRFGFITTNSIRQIFNRRVVQSAMDDGVYLTFAIPDHPWIDSSQCAAVRIAMTVGASRLPKPVPQIQRVVKETPVDDTGENDVQLALELGPIAAELRGGADVGGVIPLKANAQLSFMGAKLVGDGFIVEPAEVAALTAKNQPSIIRPFRNGRDLTESPRGVMVIDTFGLSADDLRERYPTIYERLLTRVKPLRDENKDRQRREKWWLHGRSIENFRDSVRGLRRYIATSEVSKHRYFTFVDGDVLPDGALITANLDDAFGLGVLSSRIHVVFALAAGGRMGVGNDPRYNNSRCFDPFPFPDCTEKQKECIRALAEELDAHRKRAQQQHRLGLTDIYNVLEKIRQVGRGVPGEPPLSATIRDGEVVSSGLTVPESTPHSSAENGRAGESRTHDLPHPIQTAARSASAATASTLLTTKEKAIHDAALVSTLQQLHDDLDRAVADAYGWPWPMTDAEILERVVALNAQRAKEEAEGKIRWLRPEYQIPALSGPSTKQTALNLSDAGDLKSPATGSQRFRKARVAGNSKIENSKSKMPWPKAMADRAKAIETALANAETPQTAQQLAKQFLRASAKDVEEILQTLVALGQAHESDTKGTYVR